MPAFFLNKKIYHKLSDKEVLELAIFAEEEDTKIYQQYASYFKNDFPETSKMFQEMCDEENDHRRLLLNLYKKFKDVIPYIKREHVSAFTQDVHCG